MQTYQQKKEGEDIYAIINKKRKRKMKTSYYYYYFRKLQRLFFSIHYPYPFILKYINFDKHKAKMAKRKSIELSQTDPIILSF